MWDKFEELISKYMMSSSDALKNSYAEEIIVLLKKNHIRENTWIEFSEWMYKYSEVYDKQLSKSIPKIEFKKVQS